MARFLLTVWPFTGHINPNMAIARALRERGHEVAFYTGVKARSVVEGEGFRCFLIRRVDEAHVEHVVLSAQGILSRPRNPFRLRAMWREFVLGTVPAQLADLGEVRELWPPDVILCDPTMWAPFLILHEVWHVPVAVFSLIPACMLSGRDSPIPGIPLPRPRNSYARLRARALRALVDRFLRDVRRGASALRQTHGLSPIHTSVSDFAGQMPLSLVPGSPEFDYQRNDVPASVQYVGPCLWSGSRREPSPEWLGRLPRDRPLVYVSEGTIHLQPRVLKAAAQGLANRPPQVIITTGQHRDP